MSEDRTENPKYVSWSKAVKVRDLYRCTICNVGDGAYVESHHKNSWDWDILGRFSLDNGVTLCKPCHTNFHHIFSYGGNHEYQFEQFKKIYLIFKKIASSQTPIDTSIIVSTEK